ncbi:LysE/ArgO family amino acid transporter [Cellulomonas biazotea]|uniref:Putative transporter n=1 Tax=Cellulomonas biazotea TaxID=1709 RepID=A0A402DQ55_9CELL|nr:LysE/ArgO family amino acid transporter [Cellulomonas biazotea]GCE76263.1 putative transporter [Cellulomonas biazotea]
MLPAALTGFLTGLSLIVAIGAQNAFVLRQGLRREHVLPVVLLCAGADALLIALGIAGLGSLVTGRPAVLQVVRFAGAAFLLVLAVGAARRARHPEHLDPTADGPGRRSAVLLTCLALTFLNPHVYLDTVVLLGGLAHQHPAAGGWAFGAGAVTASLTWFTVLGFGAGRLRPLFARPRAWQVLDVVVAVVMTTLAVTLLVGG